MKQATVRKILRAKQGAKCCYCRRHMMLTHKTVNVPDDAETLEHLQRRADGGSNAWGNLALACARCNRERGAMDWLTYKSWRLGEFLEFIECAPVGRTGCGS
jgi:5-methylcytosine-specific restriction endonuclease McrA